MIPLPYETRMISLQNIHKLLLIYQEEGGRGQKTNVILFLASLSITLPFSKRNICIAQEPLLSLLGET